MKLLRNNARTNAAASAAKDITVRVGWHVPMQHTSLDSARFRMR